MKTRAEKGIVLVQVVVLTMLMTLIASYLAQWAFARYQLSVKQQDFVDASGRAKGCLGAYLTVQYANMANGTMPTGTASQACSVSGTTGWGDYASTGTGTTPVTVNWSMSGSM